MTNETTLKNLNTALQMELTAAHQYQLHAHVLDDWGLDKLADQMREEFAEKPNTRTCSLSGCSNWAASRKWPLRLRRKSPSRCKTCLRRISRTRKKPLPFTPRPRKLPMRR